MPKTTLVQAESKAKTGEGETEMELSTTEHGRKGVKKRWRRMRRRGATKIGWE